MKTVLDVGTGRGEFILDAHRTRTGNFYIGVDVVKAENWLSAHSLNEYFARKCARMLIKNHLYKMNREKRLLKRLVCFDVSLEEALDRLKSLKSDMLDVRIFQNKGTSKHDLFTEDLDMYHNVRAHKIHTRIAGLFSESLVKKIFRCTFGEFLSSAKPFELMRKSLSFLSSVQFILADGRCLPFRAQSMNIVVSFGLHAHESLEEDKKLSEQLESEINRVLKNQGHQIVDQKAYINQPNVDSNYWMSELLAGRLRLDKEKEIEAYIKRFFDN